MYHALEDGAREQPEIPHCISGAKSSVGGNVLKNWAEYLEAALFDHTQLMRSRADSRTKASLGPVWQHLDGHTKWEKLCTCTESVRLRLYKPCVWCLQ